MTDFIAIPTAPTKQTLIRFFSERRPCSVKEAAQLLGWTEPQLYADLQREGALRDDEQVLWEDVAIRFLRAWPLDWVIRTLGKDATLLPEGLQLVPVTWHLPRYLVLAMETQAKIRAAGNPEIHTDEIGDLVTDLLHPNIEPLTVEALSTHSDFLEAFHFPHRPGDEEFR
jgi:hypothetical protein